MRRTIARVALLLLLAAPAASLWGSAAEAGPTASIRIVPLGQEVQHDAPSFDISIWVIGIDHHGRIPYDDNNDDTPDRFEPSEGLGAYELTVSYDPTIIAMTSARSGTFLASTGRASQCFGRSPDPGVYAIGCLSSGEGPGPQAAAQLAEMTFRPLARGSTIIALEAQMAGPLGDDIPVDVNGGVVVILGGQDPGPTPTDEPPGNNDDDDDDTPPHRLDEDGSPSHIPVGLGPLPDYLRIGPSQSGGNESQDPAGGPIAGMGYLPPTSLLPFILTGVLGLIGVALVATATRLRRVRR